MRFLSHLLAAILAVVALAPTLDAGLTTTRATVTHQVNTASHQVGAQPGAQPRVLDEDDPRWACWVHGNGVCSSVPLDGPGDVPPAGQAGGASSQVTGVPPVCSTDAECDAWDTSRGIVAWT